MCTNIVVCHLVKHRSILTNLLLSQLKIKKILRKPAPFPLQVLEVFFKSCRTYNCSLGSRTNATKINKLDLNKIKLWNSDDADLPRFDELTHCEIAKWAIFKIQFWLLFSYVLLLFVTGNQR